ncbi:MAG: phage tail sheath family protein [Gammaproteobacteria bacterium]
MSEYLTPGVYYEKVDASLPKITGVRTDIAGFVGIAKSGPLDTPVPVESFRQFVSHFGGFSGASFLAYSVQAFFANGGRRCWVVRVASRDESAGATAAFAEVRDTGGNPVWRIAAANPGRWGEKLTVKIRLSLPAQTCGDPGYGDGEFTAVASVSGFERGSLVHVSQVGFQAWRVVSYVDPHLKRLYWKHPLPALGLPYDRRLSAPDAASPLFLSAVGYDLLVFDDGEFRHRIAELSLVPEHTRYGPRLLRGRDYPLSLQADGKLPAAPLPVVVEALGTVTDIPKPLDIVDGETLSLSGGREGLAALTAGDFIGEPVAAGDNDLVKSRKLRGVRALAEVSEVSVMAAPDILIQPEADPQYLPLQPSPVDPCLKCPPPPEAVAEPNQPVFDGELPPLFGDDDIYRVQAAMIELCESRADCFAVLDAPFNAVQNDAFGLGAVLAWRQRFETSYAALYYPWVAVADPRGTAPLRKVPCCGHVAGQIAAHDLNTGVHKAPANRPLQWLHDVTAEIDFGRHGILNPAGVNLIRAEAGRGLRIMGARTLSGDPDWRYVNVRRLIMMIRKAVDISTQWAAFEPNDEVTRSKMTLTLNSFLLVLWQKGMFTGAAAEEAFFVRCSEDNNPPEQREIGRLLAEIGVAPSKPFEFVVLRVGRQGETVRILEFGGIARAA